MKGFGVLLRRELALAWGKGGGPLLALTFYACVVVLLPMASGRAPER
ncbi:MAG: heme exporter protein CcmB, partial [Phenylobacterium zucineum]